MPLNKKIFNHHDPRIGPGGPLDMNGNQLRTQEPFRPLRIIETCKLCNGSGYEDGPIKINPIGVSIVTGKSIEFPPRCPRCGGKGRI